ncbi:CbtA family protein [Methylomarinum vadi]|uniref:CbtA family protein n=1 Tax=Methylomarinum vadi TaxID=438855 RepID=UPI000AFAE0FC|nr:CbtA family protein [Methylomarinum vadi]
MGLFKSLLLTAGISGIAAAILLSLMQMLWVTPLILEAETFEVGLSLASDISADAIAGHEHPDEAWQPEDGWQRTLATISSNIVMAIGFALMLTGAYCLRRPSRWTGGLSWGLGAYAVFFVAPSLGLPPELPGTESAELVARQYWWLATVCATAAGLGLLFLQNHQALKLAGALLIWLPHAIGAPQPVVAASLAPAALEAQFIQATAVSNLLFWLVLGGLSAALAIRFQPKKQNPLSPAKESAHG